MGHDRPGAVRDAYEPERLFGGLMPGRDERGDVEMALNEASARVDVSYRMGANHHNPLEAAIDDRGSGTTGA